MSRIDELDAVDFASFNREVTMAQRFKNHFDLDDTAEYEYALEMKNDGPFIPDIYDTI